jgi:hypothetical protein
MRKKGGRPRDRTSAPSGKEAAKAPLHPAQGISRDRPGHEPPQGSTPGRQAHRADPNAAPQVSPSGRYDTGPQREPGRSLRQRHRQRESRQLDKWRQIDRPAEPPRSKEERDFSAPDPAKTGPSAPTSGFSDGPFPRPVSLKGNAHRGV